MTNIKVFRDALAQTKFQHQYSFFIKEYFILLIFLCLGQENAGLHHKLINIYTKYCISFFCDSVEKEDLIWGQHLSYFQKHFYAIIQTCKWKYKYNEEFFQEIYYLIKEQGLNQYFSALTDYAVEYVAQKTYSAILKLMAPCQCRIDLDGNLRILQFLTNNDTGATNLNKTKSVLPFLYIKDWHNTHQVKLYNTRIIAAINMAQSFAFVINQ